jgi:hypothetical protein
MTRFLPYRDETRRPPGRRLARLLAGLLPDSQLLAGEQEEHVDTVRRAADFVAALPSGVAPDQVLAELREQPGTGSVIGAARSRVAQALVEAAAWKAPLAAAGLEIGLPEFMAAPRILAEAIGDFYGGPLAPALTHVVPLVRRGSPAAMPVMHEQWEQIPSPDRHWQSVEEACAVRQERFHIHPHPDPAVRIRLRELRGFGFVLDVVGDAARRLKSIRGATAPIFFNHDRNRRDVAFALDSMMRGDGAWLDRSRRYLLDEARIFITPTMLPPDPPLREEDSDPNAPLPRQVIMLPSPAWPRGGASIVIGRRWREPTPAEEERLHRYLDARTECHRAAQLVSSAATSIW